MLLPPVNSYESIYAQSIVSKIRGTTSKEEIEKILMESNIEENARMCYIENIKNSIDPNKYYVIPLLGEKKLMKGEKVIEHINRLSLTEIKDISEKIKLGDYYKVAIVVPAVQCGKIPLEGSVIRIYDRSKINTYNNKSEYIEGIVESSYIIVSNIDYKESKKVSRSFTEDEDTTILSSTSDIEYSLKNIPGILYATAAEKLDYYKVISKFGKYGEKLNKITSDTQIFDENAKYLLIVSVPSPDIPRLLSIQSSNIYIIVVEE
ncbi:MAG TPA: DUF515 domain-containing protein [Candidatus Nanopusillus sp.]|nr:DUF515 domain-containing protein [Candidatus Nanopusillus sp.]